MTDVHDGNAACLQADTDLFFPDNNDTAGAAAAYRICLTVCQPANGDGYLAACHAMAEDKREPGVWGGTTVRQRDDIRNGVVTLQDAWAQNRARLAALHDDIARPDVEPDPDADVAADIISALADPADRIGVDDVLGRNRRRLVAKVRSEAMWVCVNVLGWSYIDTGRVFDGRDRSTVRKQVETVDRRCKGDGGLVGRLAAAVPDGWEEAA